MYYVNREQIELRLSVIPILTEACEGIADAGGAGPEPGLVVLLAQERVLHLAIELVTDVGSLLIDGFLMRDASSYEDIVEILRGEGVFGEELEEPLVELVRLRRPLVQEYMRLERNGLHPLLGRLPDVLERFRESVRRFIAKELGEPEPSV